MLYTLADAAVSADPAAAGPASGTADAAVQKNGGWFGFISEAMEVVLKVLEDGLTAVHVPYAYGFAIILLTVIVKIATYPLTKKQVESTLAMQNLQPKIKAIQERYKGNQVGTSSRFNLRKYHFLLSMSVQSLYFLLTVKTALMRKLRI